MYFDFTFVCLCSIISWKRQWKLADVTIAQKALFILWMMKIFRFLRFKFRLFTSFKSCELMRLILFVPKTTSKKCRKIDLIFSIINLKIPKSYYNFKILNVFLYKIRILAIIIKNEVFIQQNTICLIWFKFFQELKKIIVKI